jgi:cation:H+ antiporter
MLIYLTLALSFFGLFLGGDRLVKGASGLALRFGVAPMIIGLTIVGFGTSTPELLVSLTAAFGGQPGIAIGNVIGSNIANILLILGIAAVIAAITVAFADIRQDLLWMTGAVLILPLLFRSGTFGLVEGLLMVSALGVYLVISLRGPNQSPDDLPEGYSLVRSGALVLLGLCAVVLGAHFLAQSATIIARDFGISEAMIALSIVAIGTSLPELATTVMAVIRGQRDIAVGHVIGSNIFNVLGILGITALLTPVPLAPRFLSVDTPLLIAVTIAVVALLWASGKIGRTTGIVMLAGYAAYIVGTADL